MRAEPAARPEQGPLAGVDPREPIVRAWQGAKYTAPALGGMCLFVGLAFVPGLLLSPGITPVAVVCAVLLAGPAWAGSLAVADLIYADVEPGFRQVPRQIRRQAVGGIRTASPMGFAAVSFLVAWAGYSATAHAVYLVPAAIGGAASLLFAVASPFAFLLRQLTELRGKRLWLAAIALAITKPTLSLGVLAVIALFFFAGLNWTVSLLILLPGPLALLSVVAVRTASIAKGVDLPERSA